MQAEWISYWDSISARSVLNLDLPTFLFSCIGLQWCPVLSAVVLQDRMRKNMVFDSPLSVWLLSAFYH